MVPRGVASGTPLYVENRYGQLTCRSLHHQPQDLYGKPILHKWLLSPTVVQEMELRSSSLGKGAYYLLDRLTSLNSLQEVCSRQGLPLVSSVLVLSEKALCISAATQQTPNRSMQ